MTIAVIDPSRNDLLRIRDRLLASLRMSESELRDRVRGETATADERSALARLDEIAFLLGEAE